MSLETIAADQSAWECTCPQAITSDVIWKMDAYRASLFLADLARRDMRRAAKHGFDKALASQLLCAVGSISANFSEGYSRSTYADRLRFLDYSLGSDRECITWYRMAADVIPPDALADRLILIAQIRALLLGFIGSVRKRNKGRREFEP